MTTLNGGDPSFYISIVSSACLFLSEILPFIPIKSNGFVEMVINIFKKNSKVQNLNIDGEQTTTSGELNIDMRNNNNEILKLIQKQEETIHELSNKLDTLIIVLKK